MPEPASKLRVFASTLTDHHLRPVLLAYLTFNLTELGSWIALLVWAYQRDGITGASLLATLQLVPAAVLAPAGAALLGRLTHVRALALGYALQAAFLVASGALIVTGAPNTVVVPVIIASAVSITLTRPVHFALLPLLSRRTEDLTAANGMSSVAEGAAAFLGPLLSGAVTGWLGPGHAVAGFGVLCALAAARTIRIKPVAGAVDNADLEQPPTPARVLSVVREPGVLVLTSLSGLGFVVSGMLDILLVALALDLLDLPASGPGLMTSAVGVGMVVGGFATLVLVGRKRLSGPLVLALVTLGFPLALLGIAGRPAIAFVLVIAVGASRSFFDVTARTLTQRVLPDRLLNVVFGIQESMLMAGLCIGALLAPVLTSAFGVRGAFVAAGVGFPLLALPFLPRIIGLDRSAVVSLAEYRLLESVPMLALLPPRVIERLARDSNRVEVAAGTPVVTQGEAGDAFYVIETGSAEVRIDGRPIGTLGPGSWFGEVALLRDVPRTATVTTVADSSLLAVDRFHFLLSVTGAPVRAALDEHAKGHYPDLEAN